ncbi:hypothetical protein [Sphingopyxis sp. JAI128]|uniref:hypothetical protein n=1 Tax=Sphingopyxis sp. JAI128 TaxID=2723066 RepID=UPI00161DAEB3|nr:hypothetical protein [Sphingopyxis sp. JAI128]MBB6425384.1 hypothetical protein [Sphingopyxis sp. JAI128]
MIISIPHAAAFGAFISTYDFRQEWAFVEGSAFLVFLQVTTVWLGWVHDLLRNTFLRVGHMGFWQAFKHGGLFILCFIFPVAVAIVSIFSGPYVDGTAIFLIGVTMFSWVFAVIGSASQSYLRMMKLLGINLHD